MVFVLNLFKIILKRILSRFIAKLIHLAFELIMDWKVVLVGMNYILCDQTESLVGFNRFQILTRRFIQLILQQLLIFIFCFDLIMNLDSGMLHILIELCLESLHRFRSY